MNILKHRPLVWAALLLIAIMLCLEASGVPSPCERALADPRLQAVLRNRELAGELTVTGRIEFIEGRAEKARIRLTDFSIETPSSPLTAQMLGEHAFIRLKLFVYPDGTFPEGVHAGAYIRVKGTAQCADTPTCPGEFDMRDYYRSNNILFALQKSTVTGCSGPTSIAGILETISGALCDGMYRVLPEKDAQTATAIILGQRREMDDDAKSLYREGGIAHILAISGLHINLLAVSLYNLLRKRRFSFVLSSLLSSAVIFLFCLMTGMSVSAQRAMIMFMIWCLGQVLGRTSDTLCALAAASILIFLRYPYALTDAGFLLSFGCLISLEVFAGRIEAFLKKIHIPGFIRMNLSAGLSVQLGTLPIMCRFYYQITPWSVLVNLVVLPLIPVLMAAGLLGSITGMIFPGLGIYTGAPCHYAVRIFENVCRFEKMLPYSVVITGSPALWQCAVYYLLILLLILGVHRKNLQKHRFTTLLIPITAVFLLLARPDPGVQVIFTDVGQGDGILIRSGSRSYLVDCGSSTVKDVWKYRMEPMLKYYGIGRLDAIFVTHADKDHICGIEALFEGYERNLIGHNSGGITVGAIALPRIAADTQPLRTAANCQSVPVIELTAGGLLSDRYSKIEILYPTAAAVSAEKNECSLVLMLQAGGKKVLLTGNLENAGEQELLELYANSPSANILQADVLKCGHHGSKNATSNALLSAVKPSLAVISCGLHNKYHHPAPSLLKRLIKSGIRIRRTDRDGTIILKLR